MTPEPPEFYLTSPGVYEQWLAQSYNDTLAELELGAPGGTPGLEMMRSDELEEALNRARKEIEELNKLLLMEREHAIKLECDNHFN